MSFSKASRFLLILCVLVAPAMSTAATPPAQHPDARFADAMRQLRLSEYQFSRTWDGALTAPNRANGLRSRIDGDGLTVVPRNENQDWELTLTLTGVGRGQVEALEGDPRLIHNEERPGRVSLHHGNLVEWFVNDPRGLEHGFNLPLRPGSRRDGGPVVLELAVGGGRLQPAIDDDALGVSFNSATTPQVVRYASLLVVDSAGRELESRFALEGDRLSILFDDDGAVYPVIVDPLVSIPDWSSESGVSNSEYGTALAALGDVTGDGIDDFAVGAEAWESGGVVEGKVFVFAGSLSGISATPVWEAESDQADARFGVAVAGGDLNGDGFGDVIVGASDYDDMVDIDEGWVFVWYGSGTGLGANGNPTNADWSAQGDQPLGRFGRYVATAERLNNDAYDDLLIGASEYTVPADPQSFEGAVFAYYGSASGPNGGVNATPVDAVWTGEGNEVNSEYGVAIAAGDVNDNGFDDIIVGARSFEENFELEGRVFLYVTTGAGTSTTPIWTLNGDQNDTRLGVTVSSGDINNDGFSDVIIGADDFSQGQFFEGGGFVFNGLGTALLGGNPTWLGQVDQADAYFGFSMDSGDFNGDGFDDVIVGADGYDDGQEDEGAAFMFLGSPAGLSTTPTTIFEINQQSASFGTAVASAGDVNNDGFDDILVGAELFTKNVLQEGGAFLFYGCLDGDRDGACDAVDNCIGVANPDQEDQDADGVGTVCDPCIDVDADDVCDSSRVVVEGNGPGEEVLVAFGSTMRYFANVDGFDPGFGIDWTTFDFIDSSWTLGTYGVGYETDGGVGAGDLIQTDTGPGKTSIYTRATFLLNDPMTVESIFLGMDYDDAYVAWVNGVEVFRSGEMPVGDPTFDTDPTTGHESSNAPVPNYGILHDVSTLAIPELRAGVNVLALGVWNTGSGSSDLVVVPRLSINRPRSNTMKYLVNTSDPGLGLQWTQDFGFNDDSWEDGNFGIGYDDTGDADDLINTEVPSGASSVFGRARFNIALSTVDDVFFGVDYDDGVVAWINGDEIYRSPSMPGAPHSTPAWNADPAVHESSNGAAPDYTPLLDLTVEALPALKQGENVLAVGVWRNETSGTDDLVVVPRLSINELNVDNCIGVYNPGQEDLDDDDIGDPCDPDLDGDGVDNDVDNCPTLMNNNQANLDGDSLGDACDLCPDDVGNDADGDLICAGIGFVAPKIGDQDNCPNTPNVDQNDENGDGEGDACDPDIDGDGFPNRSDNCVFVVQVDQTNTDGDQNGDECDCDVDDDQVWEEPGTIDDLRFTKADVCAEFACLESQGECSADTDCNSDQCEDFACTITAGACTNDNECEQDQCEDLACTQSLGACTTDNDCDSDVCGGKTCTFAGNDCSDDSSCTGDFCTFKFCTEGAQGPCATQADCNFSPTDFCIGQCFLNGAQACASDASCNGDTCEGNCTIGGNICTDDAQCVSQQTDVCRGDCSVGGNQCVNDSVCVAPQIDLCRGDCTIGGNSCSSSAQCTEQQTDLCRGTCAIGGNTCVDDVVCSQPAAHTLIWSAPPTIGAVAGSFDTLRSPERDDFVTLAVCVESDELDTLTPAPATPGLGAVDYYLIRTENDCPAGTGNMGADSEDVARTGRSCP